MHRWMTQTARRFALAGVALTVAALSACTPPRFVARDLQFNNLADLGSDTTVRVIALTADQYNQLPQSDRSTWAQCYADSPKVHLQSKLPNHTLLAKSDPLWTVFQAAANRERDPAKYLVVLVESAEAPPKKELTWYAAYQANPDVLDEDRATVTFTWNPNAGGLMGPEGSSPSAK